MEDQNPDAGSYDPQAAEAKWRTRWEERGTNSVDVESAARPYYNLMMFFRRLQGWDVFEPIGFDAFGIHSENYALNVNTHPAKLIPSNVARFQEQLKRMGLMVNWDHQLSTIDPLYYRWTQWIFLKLLESGNAVKKEAPVNWCPECKTVLANEQVIDGYVLHHHQVCRAAAGESQDAGLVGIYADDAD
jgi:leucyl-tRNA synthetase